MAFVYSKPYHGVSSPLTNLTLKDRLPYSSNLGVASEVVSGYQTSTSDLTTLKNLTYQYIQNHNLIALSTGDGVIGSGSVNNPFTINVPWINQQVVSNRLYPFSQVGNPAVKLPVSIGANATINVTSNIPVYVNSNPATIAVGTYPVVGTGLVYVYVRVWNNIASWVFTTNTLQSERALQIFVGTVQVSNGQITQMNLNSVFRWENYRPAVSPQGSSIPSTKGDPWTFTDTGVWSYGVAGNVITDAIYKRNSLDNSVISGISSYTGVISGLSTIKQDQTTTLVASLSPSNIIQNVSWSTSDATIATIDQSGNLTGVGSGTAIINAMINGSVSAIFKCQIQPITVTIATADTPKVGRVSKFTASINNASGIATTNWSTSDATIATIDQSGNLTGMGLGACVVTCVVNGRYRGTLNINVGVNSATTVNVQGSTALTEQYLGQTINVFGSVNAYDYFVTQIGRSPYANEVVVFVVPSNIAVVGNHVNTPAMSFDTRWLSTNTITILNRGFILGRGADVSPTFDVKAHTTQSSSGGDGVVNTSQVAITINNSGWIAGGGGAGGYGSGLELSDTSNISGGGGAPYGLGCHMYDNDSLQNAKFSEAGPIAYITNYGITTAGNQSIYSGCGGAWGSRGLSGSNPLKGTWTVGSAPGKATQGNIKIVQNTGYIKGVTT